MLLPLELLLGEFVVDALPVDEPEPYAEMEGEGVAEGDLLLDGEDEGELVDCGEEEDDEMGVDVCDGKDEVEGEAGAESEMEGGADCEGDGDIETEELLDARAEAV